MILARPKRARMPCMSPLSRPCRITGRGKSMRPVVSLLLIACLLGSTVPSASQARAGTAADADDRLRILGTPASKDGGLDERVLRALRDSANDLQTRLGQRLDPNIA